MQDFVRVVQVLPVDGIGGVEVAASSALAGTDSMAFAVVPIGGAACEGLRAGFIAPRYRYPDDPRAVADAVVRALSFHPDVVVCSLWRSVAVLIILKIIRPKIRLVYFLHNERTQHVVEWALSSIAQACADRIWCDSVATQKKRLTAAQERRSRVISFVTERLEPTSAHSFNAKFVIWARLNRQKGIDRAIRLISELRAHGVRATFDVYGPDDGEMSMLDQQIATANLRDQITLRGPIPTSARSDAAGGATFFLHLSRFEGMAMGVVEAMQFGLIPVTTAVGEVASYVRDGENGLIVDPNSLPQAARRIARLIAQPETLAGLRAEAIATWERASLYREDVAQQALDLSHAS